MKIPWWLILLAFFGYSFWAVNYWHCQRCQCCSAATGGAAAVNAGVPMFLWGAVQPETDSTFKTWKKALLAKAGQGDTLVITGLYRGAEAFAGKDGNLGLARATVLATMMMPEMPESRIRRAAKVVSDGWSATGGSQENAEFTWSKMVLKKEAGAIIESDNAVTFLFPFNSTEKDSDPAVDNYLRKLVEKHKGTAATFVIVGHTDDVGEPAKNVALGLARATSISKFLITNGIAPNRIKSDSKGEAEPLADNTTDDGRHQNRRVIITVNQ